jgi:two-component system, response regulator PdtaR
VLRIIGKEGRRSILANKILIVEDERITAEDLEEVLKDLGYQVSAVVSSGEEAIREGERNQPDLVLMDIRIKGDMDGAETARILRERFDVPVVYLTAHADRDTLERAKHSRDAGLHREAVLRGRIARQRGDGPV